MSAISYRSHTPKLEIRRFLPPLIVITASLYRRGDSCRRSERLSCRFSTPSGELFAVITIRDAFITRPDGRSWPRAANTWRVAPAYVEALIRPGSHKTLRGIGKRLNINEHRVRRFISESPWEHDAVQDYLNESIPEAIGSPKAMLIVDDVDILKNGHDSVGVKRQYAGSLGHIASCHSSLANRETALQQ